MAASGYSSEEEEEEALLVLMMATKPVQKRKRRWWVHETLSKRKELGEFHTLVNELYLDEERFHQYFRMSKCQFTEILSFLKEDLARQATYLRQPISPTERLAICLR